MAINIERALLALLAERGTTTACPSEVARKLGGATWRDLMQPVRDVAANLQDKGRIDAYQRGRPVQVREARGPIRLRARAVKTIDYRAHPERYVIGRVHSGNSSLLRAVANRTYGKLRVAWQARPSRPR